MCLCNLLSWSVKLVLLAGLFSMSIKLVFQLSSGILLYATCFVKFAFWNLLFTDYTGEGGGIGSPPPSLHL